MSNKTFAEIKQELDEALSYQPRRRAILIKYAKGSKRNTQAHVVEIPHVGLTFGISYQSIVGVLIDGKSYRVPNRWGPTTGRHISEFGLKSAPEVSERMLSALVHDHADVVRLMGCPHCGQKILIPSPNCVYVDTVKNEQPNMRCCATHISYCFRCNTKWIMNSVTYKIEELTSFQEIADLGEKFSCLKDGRASSSGR